MMWADPVEDTMQDRIEEKLRALMLAASELDPIKVIYRGEPGPIPTGLHPYGILFLELESEANTQGYGQGTGTRSYRYDGYIEFNVLLVDSAHLLPGPDRKINVPSYIEAKKYAQAARKAILAWGGPTGTLEQDPVISFDERERTNELVMEDIRNGLAGRSQNNVTNRSLFDFHIYTTRQFFG